MEKICSTCKESKPVSEFSKNKSTKDGLTTKCRSCYNEYMREYYSRNPEKHKARVAATPYSRNPMVRRAANYGLTPEELAEIMAKNGGMCEICKVRKAVHVDHCHNTKRVRGFLCRGCNMGLGQFLDNPEYLSNAIKYLSG